MKRRIISLLLAIVMVVGLLPVGVQAHEEAPDKASTRVLTTDATGYLQIRNAEELLEFAAMVNSGQYTVPARLYADIDMTNVTWREPIGFTAPYQGLFDGQGYTIKNLTVTPTGETAGLFGRTGDGAYIRNVHLQNVQVAYGGAYFCGGLIGYNSGRVEFCSVTGTIDRGGQYCAGLVGFNAQPGAVLQSYAAVTCLTGACPACQENQSGVSNVFYNSDLAGGGAGFAVTTADFACGAIAYAMGWGQDLDNGKPVQAYPSMRGAKVYAEQQRLCTADPADCVPTGNYHNTEKTVILHDIALGSDGYANGKCVNCGAECSHSGGTATCAAPAKCHICGEAYGELDKTHHDESLAFDTNGFCANGCYMPAEWVETVYQIGNAGQLFWFAELVNGGNRKANAVLIYDISLRGREWIPICSTDLYYNTTNYPDKGYEGTFDGQGHVISEFITKGISGQKCSVGLFGTLSGTVRNLGVDNMTFELNGATDVRAAGIAGQMLDGSLVENCFVTNSTLTPNNYIVGGIAACNYAGTIQNCFTYLVTVSGHGRCGNLVSDTRGDISETDRCGIVRNCYTDASRVAGTQSGGLLSDCKEGLRAAHFANGTVVWWLNNASPTGIWKQSFTTPAFVGRTVSASPISTYEQPELSEGVYQIRNESQLQWFTNYVHFTDASAKAILLEDITVKKAWVPIGSGDRPFRGSFDGNGKTVTLGSQNVYQSYYGMFGYTMGADIANLTVKGSLNLYEAVSFIGGIVGQASGGSITGCTSHVSISLSGVKADGSMKLAGIAGGLYSVDGNGCLVSGCANYGKIVGTKAKECVAGIAGYSNDKNRIVNCANYGEIYAPYCNFVAGILGYVNNSQFGGLENCLNVGKVSGSEHTVEGTTLLPADIIGWARDFATDSIRNNYYRGYFAFGAVRSDKTAEAEKVSDSHLASGKIAYLLGEGWGQVIGTEDYPVPGGQKVSYGYDTCDATQTAPVYTNKTAYDEKPAHTASYTANGDTHSILCKVCGIAMAEPEAHSYENGTCICGATEAPQLDESIKIYHTLDLASDISVTFAVLKSAMERYDSYYLEVVLPEYKGNVQAGTSTVRIEPVDKGNYYYFTLTGITAVRMGDMVDAVLHMTKDGRKYISKTDSYSIATYAYAMLNSTTDSKMLTLCADLLRYGAQAQRYKNYRTDALVDAAMTEAHRSYLSDTEALTFTATDSLLGDLASPVIPWVGKTLDLGSKVGMKLVFNAKNYSGDMANLSMKVSYRGSNGETKTVTLTGAEVYNANNGYYSFTFYGLLASELRTVVDVAVYEGETQLTQTLRYSAESYAAKNLAGTLATLCRALFAYSDSAKAYFTK